jgi:hypothetical protein
MAWHLGWQVGLVWLLAVAVAGKSDFACGITFRASALSANPNPLRVPMRQSHSAAGHDLKFMPCRWVTRSGSWKRPHGPP